MNCEYGFFNEFTAFFRRQITEPLSCNARMLWLLLLHRSNETFWNGPLHLATKELSCALNVSESALNRARAELVDKNYLLYDPASNQYSPGQYLLLSAVVRGEIIVSRARAGVENAGTELMKAMKGGDSA